MRSPSQRTIDATAKSKRRGTTVPAAAAARKKSSGSSAAGAGRPAACACGGNCPRCQAQSATTSSRAALESDADRAAQRVRSMAAPADAAAGARGRPAAAPTKRVTNLGSGAQLPVETRARFEPRFGVDFDHVRVHTGNEAAASARENRAEAYTHGTDIVFGEDKYAPGTATGDRLIAHELAHVVQQTTPAGGGPAAGPVAARAAAPAVARSVDDWLRGSEDVRSFSYTQLVGEIDELNQWMDRQMSSSDDTVRIEEVLRELRAELTRRDRSAAGPAPARGRDRRRRRSATPDPAASAEPLPERYPRVLLELTSVHYDDPADMRAEYDLIMQWLARPETSDAERRILNAERESLAPQLNVDRERVVRERHAGRVRAALTPADPESAGAIVDLARTITGISGEPGNPNLFYIYHQGERVAISREQAEGLRENLWRELSNAGRSIQNRASYYWDRYHAQIEINEEHWFVSGISGWLADVEDPGMELTMRYMRITADLGRLRGLLNSQQLVEAARLLPDLETLGQEIGVMARAFYEGYIEGAEIAVRRLEFTRNAAFAVAGAIAAVVAAPVVAGFVGSGGLGLTGAWATGATIVGTGTTVGGGMGLVRGGSSAAGTLIAGGSLAEAGGAFRSEGWVGFRDGFIAGAGGSAARSLGIALRGAGPVLQITGRIAGEAIINGASAMADVLLRGGSIEEAARAGAIAAVSAVPGALLGGSNSPAVRRLVAPFVAGATAYVSARANRASPEDALASACTAVASNLLMSSAAHGAEADAALEARGREMGASTRSTLEYGMRRVRSTTAAVIIGTATALPPLRSGYGGTPVALDAPISAPLSSRPTSVAPPVDLDLAPRPAGPHTETATAPAAPHAETTTAPAPVARPAEAAPAAATTSTAADTAAPGATSAPASADEFNLDALEGPAERGPIRATGRTVESGRGRAFASLERVALSAGQRVAAIRLHGQRLAGPLRAAWDNAVTARETAELATIQGHVNAGRMDDARALARAMFNRHRSRFWSAVRRDPALRQVFTDAGMEFIGGSGAPVYRDPVTGEILDRMTIEHSTRLADDPLRAVDGSNLQTVLGDENSVALEFIRANDPFQR